MIDVSMREQDGHGAQSMLREHLRQWVEAVLAGIHHQAVLTLAGCDHVTIGAP